MNELSETEKIKAIASIVHDNKDLISQGLDFIKSERAMSYELKRLEIESNERIVCITQKYQAFRDFLTCVYGERSKALNAHYATLDKALNNNDREIIIASLRGISSIVEKNPIEQFESFQKVLRNDQETLYLEF